MSDRGHTVFRFAAVVAVLACYATILLGGNVMASGSGLGCPDWPSCNGTFAPPLNGAMGIEWAHRLAAGTLGLLVLSVAALAVLYERGRPMVLRLAGASLSLVMLEALLGGVVVESDLVIALVLLHLAIATLLFGLLVLLALVANLREIPRRWVEWARRAADERPASERLGAVEGTPQLLPAPAVATLRTQ